MAIEKRLSNIEWLRIVAMIAIVIMHIDACYTYTVLPATRFAVPLFFMITGYFLGDQSSRSWKKYILTTLVVFLGATLFYGMIELAGSIYNHTDMLQWPWGKILLKWIVFNSNPFHYHLWYLGAYLYILCIAACIDKFHWWRWAYWLIIPLFIARFGLQCTHLPKEITRNFLFIGLPCFLTGSWLRNYRHWYVSHFQNIKWIWVCLLFAALPFAEDYILSRYMGVVYGDFVSSYLLAASLLVAAVELPQRTSTYLPHNTRNIVLGVYIFHPFVHFLYNHIPFTQAWVSPDTWSAPIIVFISTWILCVILLYVFPIVLHDDSRFQ